MKKYSAFFIASILLSGVLLKSGNAQGNRPIELQRRYTGLGYSLCGSCSLPTGISSTLQLAPGDEPGEAVLLSGIVFQENGLTPDSGITLFLYQADAGGYYHRPREDVFHPKIFGWLRTGSDGRYEIHTIKPAPEVLAPNEPAHIHVHIYGKGMPEHFLHEFWFNGDSRIEKDDSARFSHLGDFSPIVTLKKGSDGIWRGTRNIRVRPAAQWRYESDR